jgi:hypothetical protein
MLVGETALAGVIDEERIGEGAPDMPPIKRSPSCMMMPEVQVQLRLALC